MRFLADESCDFRVVRALRAAGHDVSAVSELAPRAEDPAVIEWAAREARIFLTEDRDFGRLVYAARQPASGVILLRYPTAGRGNLPDVVADIVTQHGEKLRNRFVVIQPGRVRFSAIPNY